jgi:hypothetical protein
MTGKQLQTIEDTTRSLGYTLNVVREMNQRYADEAALQEASREQVMRMLNNMNPDQETKAKQ